MLPAQKSNSLHLNLILQTGSSNNRYTYYNKHNLYVCEDGGSSGDDDVDYVNDVKIQVKMTSWSWLILQSEYLLAFV